LDLEGPDLSVQGQRRGRVFTLQNAHIGRTIASGTLTAPASPSAPWVLRATGAVLDLRRSGWKASTKTPAKSSLPKPTATGAPWQATLAFQTLYVSKPPAPGLADVSFSASGQGYNLNQATGSAQGVSVTVAPVSATRHSLNIQGDDAGTLLQALGVYGAMRGGKLALQAEYGGGPADGVLKLSQARLVNAPGFIKILQAATLYGVAEAVSGPGLLIDHATVPFTLDNDVLSLHGADAYSESLGFTASGTVNTGTGICNLATTIIPAYAINALPGKIPLLGHLFSAEKGGGLIAMRAHVQGPLDNPDVRVNPLSALTPGFLRGIFGLGGGKPQSPPPAKN
ncbi:MAG: AsmA-like C-terminal domain-containing protein, partial [Rhodospirillales bacterium]|nr:AsmA-like C-terminal domain-containing protein [Rhodospirillales bacterium]